MVRLYAILFGAAGCAIGVPAVLASDVGPAPPAPPSDPVREPGATPPPPASSSTTPPVPPPTAPPSAATAVDHLAPPSQKPRWPAWFGVARDSAILRAEGGATTTLKGGTLLGLLGDRGDEQEVMVVASGQVGYVSRLSVTRSDVWEAGYGEETTVSAGEHAGSRFPTIARGTADAVWIRMADGSGRLVTAKPTKPAPTARVDTLYLPPGSRVELTCGAPLLADPGGAEVGATGKGPASVFAGRGDWILVHTAGVQGWVPATCAGDKLVRVASIEPLPVLGIARPEPLLIHFWATWCAPCVKELAEFSEFAASAGRQALAVSEDFRREDAHGFLGRFGYRFRCAWDEEGRLLARLGGSGLPLTIVVDRQGAITHRWEGTTDWRDPAVLSRIGR